ncbi:MAG: hypothetical protein HY401_01965 [Elusimicrobia bacterium]|nr:hypothetical protein [Elusimicrobiota bacterium]
MTKVKFSPGLSLRGAAATKQSHQKDESFYGIASPGARNDRMRDFWTKVTKVKRTNLFFSALFTLIILFTFPLYAIESQVGYEYWRLSFFSPSRVYRLRLTEKTDIGGTDYVEYIRTDRFNRWDNTFHIGYTGKYEWLGWDLMGGFTPQAAVTHRQIWDLTLYLPSPGYGLEPTLRGVYRQFTPARIKSWEGGFRWVPSKGWDATSRWGRSKTDLLGVGKKPAKSTFYQLGYMYQAAMRVFGFQGAWKEFFDSGNPLSPGEYSIKEKGAGFQWALPTGIGLIGSYALERRSNLTEIKKYNISVNQSY